MSGDSIARRSTSFRAAARSLPVVVAALLVIGAAFYPSIAHLAGASLGAQGSKIVAIAAEDQYGSMVAAIGGNRVSVTSLLNNPNTDPHEFEASASTAVQLAHAQLVIENGIGYDSWIDKLIDASPRADRIVLNVGESLGHKPGDNPHVWYDPAGWASEASAIASALIKLDPSHRAGFQRRRIAWLASLRPVHRWIEIDRRLLAGRTVIATEPVYGYMLAALGVRTLDPDFQKAIMDGIDPSPRSVAQFEHALREHSARMLFYNSQVSDPTTANMRGLAIQSGVPVVGVTETQPSDTSFVQWQVSQLRSIKLRWG